MPFGQDAECVPRVCLVEVGVLVDGQCVAKRWATALLCTLSLDKKYCSSTPESGWSCSLRGRRNSLISGNALYTTRQHGISCLRARDRATCWEQNWDVTDLCFAANTLLIGWKCPQSSELAAAQIKFVSILRRSGAFHRRNGNIVLWSSLKRRAAFFLPFFLRIP